MIEMRSSQLQMVWGNSGNKQLLSSEQNRIKDKKTYKNEKKYFA